MSSRIWWREAPKKQPKKGRPWLNDGSCIRPRPEHPNQFWSYDFAESRPHIDALSDLFILRGMPGHVRSDNGPEFIAYTVRKRVLAVGAKAAFIEPGGLWENRYCESFNSKLRDELLNGEIFCSLAEANVIIWPTPPRGSAPPSAQPMTEKPIMN